jgi:hypothetical protein
MLYAGLDLSRKRLDFPICSASAAASCSPGLNRIRRYAPDDRALGYLADAIAGDLELDESPEPLDFGHARHRRPSPRESAGRAPSAGRQGYRLHRVGKAAHAAP